MRFTLMLLAVAMTGCIHEGPLGGDVEISALNNSTHDFADLTFDTFEWGDLAAGEQTDFYAVDKAYDYTYVNFFVGDVEFTIQPIDFMGETPVEPGAYIYEINVEDETSGVPVVTLVEEGVGG